MFIALAKELGSHFKLSRAVYINFYNGHCQKHICVAQSIIITITSLINSFGVISGVTKTRVPTSQR